MNKIRFIQIVVSSNHLYGLDEKGTVWFRALVPYSNVTSTTACSPAKKEEEEKKKLFETVWKRLSMRCLPPKELLKIEDAEKQKLEPIEAPEDKGEMPRNDDSTSSGPLKIEVDSETDMGNMREAGPWEIEGSEV